MWKSTRQLFGEWVSVVELVMCTTTAGVNGGPECGQPREVKEHCRGNAVCRGQNTVEVQVLVVGFQVEKVTAVSQSKSNNVRI
jgi:hypothetical protein